jgi:nucleoside-diphosphate-sugar epimerase
MPGVRTVLVTEVSGHVAGAMADRLAAGALRVRAMVRTPDQARMAARRGWRPVTGDLAASPGPGLRAPGVPDWVRACLAWAAIWGPRLAVAWLLMNTFPFTPLHRPR